MTISTEILRHHVAYTAWATARLMEAVSQLSEEELTRDFETADKSVLGTLAHIYGSDRIWLARLEGTPSPALVTDEDRNLTVLKRDWPLLHARWGEWVSRLDEKAPEAEVSYSDTKGRPWRQPLWQLILHVVNHDTHHRGQVAGFVRALGYTPPPLDLVAYYRSERNR
jgi:uncharacterized damage-inducible protein DinB